MQKVSISFTNASKAVAELDVLWLTAGLSCDGDSISVTAATQPSLEDILLGALPGLPPMTAVEPRLVDELFAALEPVSRDPSARRTS